MSASSNLSFGIERTDEEDFATALVAVNIRNIADAAGVSESYARRIVRQRIESLFEDLSVQGVKAMEREDIDDDWEL